MNMPTHIIAKPVQTAGVTSSNTIFSSVEVISFPVRTEKPRWRTWQKFDARLKGIEERVAARRECPNKCVHAKVDCAFDRINTQYRRIFPNAQEMQKLTWAVRVPRLIGPVDQDCKLPRPSRGAVSFALIQRFK